MVFDVTSTSLVSDEPVTELDVGGLVWWIDVDRSCLWLCRFFNCWSEEEAGAFSVLVEEEEEDEEEEKERWEDKREEAELVQICLGCFWLRLSELTDSSPLDEDGTSHNLMSCDDEIEVDEEDDEILLCLESDMEEK